jgi:hypothetical protein
LVTAWPSLSQERKMIIVALLDSTATSNAIDPQL